MGKSAENMERHIFPAKNSWRLQDAVPSSHGKDDMKVQDMIRK